MGVILATVESIIPHPNADRLAIAKVRGHQAIVGIDENGAFPFFPGDWVGVIEPDSVVPEAILRTIGLWDDEKGKGMLAGTKGTRVKPKKLRGINSTAVLLHFDEIIKHSTNHHDELSLGDDMADDIGVTRYEAPIPSSMSGKVYHYKGRNPVSKYDIERLNFEAAQIYENQPVHVTEKIHGTNIQIGFDGVDTFWVASKGLGAQNLFFQLDAPENAGNIYVKAFSDMEKSIGVKDALSTLSSVVAPGKPIVLVGELYGDGVQDLNYGLHQEKRVAFFDIIFGEGTRVPPLVAFQMFEHMGLPTVPVLTEVGYMLSAERIAELKAMDYDDNVYSMLAETITGFRHMPEGVVFRSHMGTEVVKLVFDFFLTRKGGTEYN